MSACDSRQPHQIKSILLPPGAIEVEDDGRGRSKQANFRRSVHSRVVVENHKKRLRDLYALSQATYGTCFGGTLDVAELY